MKTNDIRGGGGGGGSDGKWQKSPVRLVQKAVQLLPVKNPKYTNTKYFLRKSKKLY